MKKIVIVLLATLSLSVSAFAQVSDSIQDDQYVMSQDFVAAEILRVSTRNRTITVKGEAKGQTRQFTIPKNARITFNGEEARLRDLRKGDIIFVAMKPVMSKNEIVQIKVPSSPVTLVERRADPAPVMQEALPVVLPKTGSPLPLVLLLGLISLLAGFTLRAKRLSK